MDLKIVLENKSLILDIRPEELQKMLAQGQVIFINETTTPGYRIGSQDELRDWIWKF